MFKHFRLSRVIAILIVAAPFFGFVSDSSAVTKFNIKVDPSISLTVDSTAPSVRLNSPDSEIHQVTVNASVTTNNPTGYTFAVLMSDNRLINQVDPDYKISTLENVASTDTFDVNRWGILGRDSLYHPASSGLVLSKTDAPATDAAEPLTFGVKVDATLPSGTYDCNLAVVAIANRIPYSIDVIDYMQDIDEDVIENMVVGEQHQLTDERDDKKYFISKFSDGKVWMTQNLDFELAAAGTALDTDTSNVSADKILTVSTNVATWGQDTTLAYYKDAGALYNPDGLDPADDSSSLAADSSDQHYQLGSYYSWNAATAGSGVGVAAGGTATESICPSGWRLPTTSELSSFMDSFSTVVSYAHTPNLSDDGTQSGDYANNLSTNSIVTIPGATTLHVKLMYGSEGVANDWVSLWEGSHSNYTAAGNYSSGLRFGNNTTGKYGGADGVVEGDVAGDTVTFGFRSNGSTGGYGYYAVVTGFDANGDPVRTVNDISAGLVSTPVWASYAGQFDDSTDWTAALRSFGYWSSSFDDNDQAYAFTSEETATDTFNMTVHNSVDTTKGLNVRCVADPAPFGL